MPTIREVLTKFSFEIDEGSKQRVRSSVAALGKGFKDAIGNNWFGPEFKKQMKEIGDATDGVKESFGNLTDAMRPILWYVGALGAASAGLFAATKATANYSDQVKDTAQAIGVTTDQLQSLAYAAQLSGSDFETITMSFRLLSNQIQAAGADPEQGAAKVFKRLGIAVKDAAGQLRNADAILYDIADRLAPMADGVEKTALATDLFGRAGTKLIPLLNEGAEGIRKLQDEAFKLGFVLGDDALKAGTEFNDELDRMKMVLTGLRNTIFSEFTPVLTELVTEFRNWLVENRELVKLKATEFFTGLAKAIDLTVRFGKSLYGVMDRLIYIFGGVESAIKFASAAFLLFVGANTIAKLGALTSAVLKLSSAITGIAVGGWAANAALLAIPLAFAAIGAAIFLIIDDIAGYFEGKKSVTGFVIGKLKEFWKGFQDAHPELSKFLENVASWLGIILQYLTWIIPLFWPLRALGWIADKAQRFMSDEADSREATKDWKPQLPGLAGISRDALGMPPLNPRTVPGTPDSPYANVKQENIFNIDATGMNPEQLMETIRREAGSLMDEQLRRTGQSTIPTQKR